jgi:nitrile hydratase subunit beta
MKLQHHLGGLEGLGPVDFEKRVFLEEWEKRIFGIHVAMMGLSSHLSLLQTPSTFKTEWTWADLRKGAESLNPLDYFKFRYFEKWLGGISGYLVANGYIAEEELARGTEEVLKGTASHAAKNGDPAIDDRIEDYLVGGDSPKRDVPFTNRFAVGDKVLVKNVPPGDHTRLPGFLRDRIGTIETVYDGAYGYFCSTGPDGVGPAMPVYCVRFEPAELMGQMAEPGFVLYADLFDAYLAKPVAAAA